jgi:threonine aldolase
MTKVIDLRSDTVTLPTAEMRQAMANAHLGDDVFGEDPTINELERRTAEILGKEAALFVSSGTMANQVAVRCHTEPGSQILLEAQAHIYLYEAGGIAALSGAMPACLQGRRGLFTVEDVLNQLHPPDVHRAPPQLVCLENTHNRGGGSIWPLEQMAGVANAARARGLKVHLDGARLWNATAATGIPEREYAAHCDSVSVCFSKGLGAPVGSALAGPRQWIEKARRFRKQFGGGMRQGGIIAAGALHALEHHRSRLSQDHAHARLLAEALARMPGVQLDLEQVETNMVWFNLTTLPAATAVERLNALGIRMLALGPQRIRAVTHLMITPQDIQVTINALRQALDPECAHKDFPS